jgi:rhamnogalacturonyl hydrolase YesR
VRHTYDSLINNVSDGNQMWKWNDLLFMSPSILPRLGEYFDDERYNAFLLEMYEDVHQLLYDRHYRLYYRDRTFKNKLNTNGNRIFWLRGNGWAFSGLCLILEDIDKHSIEYQYFSQIFVEMAYSLLEYQTDIGFWNSNVIDSTEFNQIEASGVAMICYGLTFGVNNDLLQKKDFNNSILKAWNVLKQSVTDQGRVSFVQATGDRPAPSDTINYYNYAAGAFLLAASELHDYFNGSL